MTIPIRVLVVDDHAIFRRVLIHMLNECDDIYVVAEAGSGDDADRLARELQPDVVLIDRRMPGLDSLTATQRIVHDLPDVRVIGISVDCGEHGPMLGAGAVAFVDKSSNDLLSLCETIRWAVQ